MYPLYVYNKTYFRAVKLGGYNKSHLPLINKEDYARALFFLFAFGGGGTPIDFCKVTELMECKAHLMQLIKKA